MISGLWGRKVGMTQIFSDGHRVVPVTVINVGNWFVTGVKTTDRDGYAAVQFGCVRSRYENSEFSADWLKGLKKYFGAVREVRVPADVADMAVGQRADISAIFGTGDVIDVSGITIGKGFQGVVKRHGHKGGRASHGDKLGRGPGSLTGMRTCGRVPKGRKLPGHMGVHKKTIKNLQVVEVQPEARLILVKGSVPGKARSLVYIQKCR